jgi:hypothetical protein
MKKLAMITMAVCLTMVVSAQHGGVRGGRRIIVISPAIGFGYSPYYSTLGYSPFNYPYGYPYGYSNGYRRESKLDRQIEDIKSDYADKIRSAKSDKSISRDERKKIVHGLKAERDKVVHDTKLNYYKPQKQASAAAEDKS